MKKESEALKYVLENSGGFMTNEWLENFDKLTPLQKIEIELRFKDGLYPHQEEQFRKCYQDSKEAIQYIDNFILKFGIKEY